METWDLVLFAVAAYVATDGLVRLMLHRRAELLGAFRGEMDRGRADREKPRDRAPGVPGQGNSRSRSAA